MPGAPTLANVFSQRIVVGVGNLAVSNDTHVTISTYALGSCIGLVVYDPQIRIGGILHCMLPDSKLSPDKAAAQPAMFADTGFTQLCRDLYGMRADRSRIRAFIAGGASVLSGTDMFKIGERNAIAVRSLVQKEGWRIKAEDIGGVQNRTLHLDMASGKVDIKAPSGLTNVSLQ